MAGSAKLTGECDGPPENRVQRMARGYLALAQGDAWTALLMLAADRTVDQDALAQAHRAVSRGYVRGVVGG